MYGPVVPWEPRPYTQEVAEKNFAFDIALYDFKPNWDWLKEALNEG